MAFTNREYADAACEANDKGQMLYVLVGEDGDESLLIAPVNYYVCEELTNRTDGTVNPNYDEELLEEKRKNKLNEALGSANNAINNGAVKVTEEAHIETNANTLTDLNNERDRMVTLGLDKTEWLSKEDIPLQLTLLELEELINYIGKYKSNVWSQYYTFKYKIENAQNIDEIAEIEIVYSFPGVEIIEPIW